MDKGEKGEMGCWGHRFCGN